MSSGENKNVLLRITYDGTNFSGWQRQPERRTVQGELERVLSELCRMPVRLNGTSRTDAGVHALGQCATFSGNFGIPVSRIAVAANHLLAGNKLMATGDVRILSAVEMPSGFHARFDAAGKKYLYRIRCAAPPEVFLRNYRYQMTADLDTDAMNRAAEYIVGTHDFKCFQASGGEEKETTVRTIYGLSVSEEKVAASGEVCGRELASARELVISVKGDGFLYNMVRILSGTLVEVGLGKRQPEELPEIIRSKDRARAGHTAPPQGLYLAEVYYKSEKSAENAEGTAF